MSNIDEYLCDIGIPIYIITKYGIKTKSFIKIEKQQNLQIEPKLCWRLRPMLCIEFSFIDRLSPLIIDEDNCFQFSFYIEGFKLTIEIDHRITTNIDILNEIYNCINLYVNKSKTLLQKEKNRNMDRDLNQLIPSYQTTLTLRKSICECAIKEEQLIQLCFYLRYKEAYMITEKAYTNYLTLTKRSVFKHWVNTIKEINITKMNRDRHRWRLHAIANQEIDLQAWYHSLFYLEVYRLRGYFWYKDAVLPLYKQSYDLVDNALTPLEEAALAHVLCSPDTSYGDVAGQMFVVQALVSSTEQFKLFQSLAAQGANIVKYPRSGRPARKLFRFSFVEGNIYLTWKGKFGNQGVGMNEVTSIVGGIHSDVLKWSAKKESTKNEQFLSVHCVDRSVDLYFDSEIERNHWKDILNILVNKEKGKLGFNIEPIELSIDAPEFEKLVLYSSISKIMNNNNEEYIIM